MSKQRCQAETTSTEFVEWIQYMDDDVHRFHREDLYAAQIAATIVKVNSSNSGQVKTQDFILKFKRGPESSDELSPEERMQRSKQFWYALVASGRKKS